MTEGTDKKIADEMARLLATWIKDTHKIHEASYVQGEPHRDGHYTKDWNRAATEAGMPEQFHPLVDLLMHWSNDTSEWVKQILGTGLDPYQD